MQTDDGIVIGRARTRLNGSLTADPVIVEVHIATGLPRIQIVGLAEGAVKESLERIRAALQNSGFSVPSVRATVNLAPADAIKTGSSYDLPIAVAFLLATNQIRVETDTVELYGELGLDGSIYRTRGLFAALVAARKAQTAVIVPTANAKEAGMLQQLTAYAADSLHAVCAHLSNDTLLPQIPYCAIADAYDATHDFADVRGQHEAKRALTVAAAGGHNVLLSGVPGAGKSMLAERMPGILPPPSEEERIAIATVHSLAGFAIDEAIWQKRPFRAPHHSASSVALVGGGRQVRPGEISLAHHGVLFLDELPEFPRQVLEVLRQPLETGSITIARASNVVTYPALFQLLAACNLCPCGFYGDDSGRCRCTQEQIARYQARMSGPLLDRIDMFVRVAQVPATQILNDKTAHTSSRTLRAAVVRARRVQIHRQGQPNARLPAKTLLTDAALAKEAHAVLTRAVDRFGLSARGAHRIIKVARTIADLASSKTVEKAHIAEALHFRNLTQTDT